MHRFAAVAGVLLSICVSLPVVAQTTSDEAEEVDTVEASDEQARLNDQGVRALSDGDYVRAITLLEEARFLGELNITLLNLGRAYQLAGRCEKARMALQQVEDAPRVPKPPPGLVESKANEYLQVLEDTCEPSSKPDRDEPPAVGNNTLQTTGIVAMTLGGTFLLSAPIMHFGWARPIRNDTTDGLPTEEPVTSTTQRDFYEARDRANTIDTVALGNAIFGGVVAGVGLYLWLSQRERESATSFRVTPSPDGVRATWTFRF